MTPQERHSMNFIIISPNFPENYRFFCDRLSRNGVNVLGIGDSPYDGLSDMLKSSLTEYYKVSTLEDYDPIMSTGSDRMLLSAEIFILRPESCLNSWPPGRASQL